MLHFPFSLWPFVFPTLRVASLVAKYRPPMPVLTLVVPRLVSDGLRWRLDGRSHARQCNIVRGLLPMLSAPGPSGDEVGGAWAGGRAGGRIMVAGLYMCKCALLAGTSSLGEDI